MQKSSCQNQDCSLYGKPLFEQRGQRIHDDRLGRIELKEYNGQFFCTQCCPDEQTAEAIIEKHSKPQQ
jgi:hypothetical protein